MRVSLFTSIREYLLTAFRTGSMMYSLAVESDPPMTISSGLKILISPAMALPRLWPTVSRISMARTSSLSIADRISSIVIFPVLLNLSDSTETLPASSFSRNIR